MEQYDEIEECLDLLYQHRERALDMDCSYNIRQEAWVAIDSLLDWYNELRGGNGTDSYV